MKVSAPLIILLSLILLSAVTASAESQRLHQLIERSRALKLAESTAWLKLVHYEPSLSGSGWLSVVDDPLFFLSAAGKRDPKAELEATLAGFFSSERKGPAEQAARCAFPARLFFLQQRLSFSVSELPAVDCSRYEEWQRSLDVESLTLIYPAAYVNNPASMFGHTLLRLDGRGQTESTRLLAYGATFAAATNESSGLLFAFRGIFGGYRGVYSVLPYYKQVRDYNDIENRDIWEYPLNLSREEVEQVVRHLWELGSVWFVYYFFDENCSYQLLALLEGAVPRLELTDDFPLWAIPPETVRSMLKHPELVRPANYRPAKSTVVRNEERASTPELRVLGRKLAYGTAKPSEIPPNLSEEDRAHLLELSFDYLEYLQETGRPPPGDAAERGRELLSLRHAIGTKVSPRKVPTPTVRPDQGHGSGRLTIGAGTDRAGPYSELGIRPAFHELLDPEPGYTRGAELRFFDVSLRASDELGGYLERFIPLGIQSLSPRSELFRPISWKLKLGVERNTIHASAERRLLATAQLGAGVAYELASRGFAYGLATLELEQSRHLENNVQAGIGPELGFFYDALDDLRLKGDIRYERLQEGERFDYSLSALWTLSLETALRLDLLRRQDFGRFENEARLAVQLYF